MKKEKNNFGFIAASSICIFLLLIMIVGNFGGKGTRADTTSCVQIESQNGNSNNCSYAWTCGGVTYGCSACATSVVSSSTKTVNGNEIKVVTCAEDSSGESTGNNVKGCKTYDSSGKCTECYGNGVLGSNGSACTIPRDIEGCTEYIETSISTYGTCRTCGQGYSRESGTCVKQAASSCKVENCGTCVTGDDNKCQNCLTGYYVNSDGSCVAKEKLPAPTCNSATYNSSSSSYKFDTKSLNGFNANTMNAQGCTITLDDLNRGKYSCEFRVGIIDSSKHYFGNNSISANVECKVTGVPDTFGKELALPSCATNTYDGTSKDLLKSTGNFEVTKNKTATNAGEYTVEVKANGDYYWLVDGQKKTTYSLKCEIDKGRPKFSLSSSSGIVWINVDSSFSINTIDDGPCGTVSYKLDNSNSSIFTDGKAPTISKNTVSFKATKPGNSSIVITGTSGSSTNTNCAPVSITYNLTVNESVKPYCRYCSNAAYYNYTWISDTEELFKPLPEGCSIDANKTSASQCGQCSYCPSNVTDAKSADSEVRGKYVWRTSSGGDILKKCNYKESYSDEKLRGLTAWQTAYDKTEDTCKGDAPDFNGPSSSSTPGGNNGGNGGNNGGNDGGIGGGDDTGNNNGGNNNATNNPQTGSTLIFVVWSIGIAMVVYSFWYFRNTKEN